MRHFYSCGPVEDEDVLARLSGTHQISGVRVVVTAIGWV